MTSASDAREEDVRAIAFYLPQFHTIPENDAWWGPGFTEWTNVTRARPRFAGHYQPHLPADMGFYDLRVAHTRGKQAALASAYGIHGFCYYYYWFAGKRLLETPVEGMLASGEPDFPYCLCWANENWTRRWDGADKEILIAQNPSRADDERLIRDLFPHFRDSRYIRVHGKPLLIVYRIGVLPDVAATADLWRTIARREGIGELYLCAAKTYDTGDPTYYGFDAVVEFPPHGLRTVTMHEQLDLLDPEFRGTVVDYRQFVVDCITTREPSYTLHRTVMPGWDNTARRLNHALVFAHASPEVYELWTRELAGQARRKPPGERLLFINAWNEWAEGAHLEPDQRFGHQYLAATQRALAYAKEHAGNGDSALVEALRAT
ncbi:MAG TPA: glycoside hydrolase family 99-like domain-containing protein [Casimicrobiaceae bacterium]|nr:glycoside hydrolase family 99-like domain-containing protein [Casimicrobiaceae bacterium]